MIKVAVLLSCLALGAQGARQDPVSDVDWDALVESGRLGTDICHDVSGSKFICQKVLAEFCTYCRRKDGNKCFMNKDVEKAESGVRTSSR